MSESLSVRRIEFLLQVGLVLLLVAGCWLVLNPFFPAILFAIVIAVSTWPAYLRLLTLLRGYRALASLIACIVAVVVIVTPAALLTGAVADGLNWLETLVKDLFEDGPPSPPRWIAGMPLLGEPLSQYWNEVAANPARQKALIESLGAPARTLALASGRLLVNGLVQASIATLVLYALYQYGEEIGRRAREALQRISGAFAGELIGTLHKAVGAVMISVIGTALAQAMVAALGFAIAGVPAPLLLAAATFVLSMVPVGPPLIWGGAALWLFHEGEAGGALFMVLYGLFAISSVDNVLKPFLISRSSHLPFAFTIMGVIGGVLAFGIIGVFIGPTLLAVALVVSRHWLSRSERRKPAPA